MVIRSQMSAPRCPKHGVPLNWVPSNSLFYCSICRQYYPVPATSPEYLRFQVPKGFRGQQRPSRTVVGVLVVLVTVIVSLAALAPLFLGHSPTLGGQQTTAGTQYSVEWIGVSTYPAGRTFGNYICRNADALFKWGFSIPPGTTADFVVYVNDRAHETGSVDQPREEAWVWVHSLQPGDYRVKLVAQARGQGVQFQSQERTYTVSSGLMPGSLRVPAGKLVFRQGETWSGQVQYLGSDTSTYRLLVLIDGQQVLIDTTSERATECSGHFNFALKLDQVGRHNVEFIVRDDQGNELHEEISVDVVA